MYDLPDPAYLSFSLESAQVHGIGNVCVLTLLINSRGPIIVWVSLIFMIILWYWLPSSCVHLWMVCTPTEKMSLTRNSDLTSLSFRWGVTSSQLSIEVFLLEELSFKSSLRVAYHLKAVKSKIRHFCMKTQNFGFVRYQYLHLYN